MERLSRSRDTVLTVLFAVFYCFRRSCSRVIDTALNISSTKYLRVETNKMMHGDAPPATAARIQGQNDLSETTE